MAKEFSRLVTVLFTYGTEILKRTELNFIKANHCLFRPIVDNLRVYKSRKAHSNYISKSNVSPGLALKPLASFGTILRENSVCLRIWIKKAVGTRFLFTEVRLLKLAT